MLLNLVWAGFVQIFINRGKLIKRIETDLEDCLSNFSKLSEENVLRRYADNYGQTNVDEAFCRTYVFKPVYESSLYYVMQRYVFGKPITTEEIVVIHKPTGDTVIHDPIGRVVINNRHKINLQEDIIWKPLLVELRKKKMSS